MLPASPQDDQLPPEHVSRLEAYLSAAQIPLEAASIRAFRPPSWKPIAMPLRYAKSGGIAWPAEADMAGALAAVLPIPLYADRLFPAVLRSRCEGQQAEETKAGPIARGLTDGIMTAILVGVDFAGSNSVYLSFIDHIRPGLSVQSLDWGILSASVLGTIYASLGIALTRGMNGMKPGHRIEDTAFSLALGLSGTVPGLLSSLRSTIDVTTSWYFINGVMLYCLLTLKYRSSRSKP